MFSIIKKFYRLVVGNDLITSNALALLTSPLEADFT